MQLVMQYSLGRGLTHDQMLCGWPRARAHEAGGAAGVSAAHGQWPRAGGHQGSRRELSQPRVRHLLIRTLTPRQRLAWCTAQHTRAADSGHQHPRGPDQQRAGDTSYKRSRRQVLFEASWTWSGRRHTRPPPQRAPPASRRLSAPRRRHHGATHAARSEGLGSRREGGMTSPYLTIR